MKTHWMTRAVTNPRAKISFCRLRIGNSTTAVPMLAMKRCGDRGDKRDQEQYARNSCDLLRIHLASFP
jgi:hypothetical protein